MPGYEQKAQRAYDVFLSNLEKRVNYKQTDGLWVAKDDITKESCIDKSKNKALYRLADKIWGIPEPLYLYRIDLDGVIHTVPYRYVYDYNEGYNDTARSICGREFKGGFQLDINTVFETKKECQGCTKSKSEELEYKRQILEV
ncbi:MAG: hypothetical protein ABEK59_03355 [Halobacteria archaeon]